MSRPKWAALVVGACLVVTAVALAYAAGKADSVPAGEVVRAQGFEVVDGEGRVRARLGLAAGQPRPILVFCDEQGKTRVSMSLLADGSPVLALSDKEAKPRAGLMLTAGGLPIVGLVDGQGKRRASLGLAGDGSPSLDLYDQGAMLRASLSLAPDGSPALAVLDKDQNTRAAVGLCHLELTASGEFRPTGEPGRETRTTAESSLVLFDKEGKVLWKAP